MKIRSAIILALVTPSASICGALQTQRAPGTDPGTAAFAGSSSYFLADLGFEFTNFSSMNHYGAVGRGAASLAHALASDIDNACDSVVGALAMSAWQGSRTVCRDTGLVALEYPSQNESGSAYASLGCHGLDSEICGGPPGGVSPAPHASASVSLEYYRGGILLGGMGGIRTQYHRCCAGGKDTYFEFAYPRTCAQLSGVWDIRGGEPVVHVYGSLDIVTDAWGWSLTDCNQGGSALGTMLNTRVTYTIEIDGPGTAGGVFAVVASVDAMGSSSGNSSVVGYVVPTDGMTGFKNFVFGNLNNTPPVSCDSIYFQRDVNGPSWVLRVPLEEPGEWSVRVSGLAVARNGFRGDVATPSSDLPCATQNCVDLALRPDGVVNYYDLLALMSSVGTTSIDECLFISEVDVNGDGTISGGEAVSFLCSMMLDLNSDGFVDFFDVDVYLDWFDTADCFADCNRDGFVDYFDMDFFLGLVNGDLGLCDAPGVPVECSCD